MSTFRATRKDVGVEFRAVDNRQGGACRDTAHASAGPIESGFGWHLVFIDSIIPGRVPVFEEIEPDVKTAWLGYEKEKAWRETYARMRARYTILLPAAPNQPSEFPAPGPKKKQGPRPSEAAPQ